MAIEGCSAGVRPYVSNSGDRGAQALMDRKNHREWFDGPFRAAVRFRAASSPLAAPTMRKASNHSI
jgi:hypothetical protein